MNLTSSDLTPKISNIDIVSWIISAVSILTSIVNVVVFAHPSLKDPTYNYLLVSSVIDTLYLILVLVLVTFDELCDSTPIMCGSRVQLVQKLYHLWIGDYLTSCMAIYSILNELFLSLQRLLMLAKVSFIKNWSVWHVGPAMMLFSLLYYMPVLVTEEVKQIGFVVYQNETFPVYEIVTYGNESRIVNTVQSVIRSFLVTIGLGILNIVTLLYYFKFIKKKSSLRVISKTIIRVNQISPQHQTTSNLGTMELKPSQVKPSRSSAMTADSRANRNITVMLVSTAFLFIAGTIPYEVLVFIKFIPNTTISPLFWFFGYNCLYLLIGLKMPVFYFCNKFFKSVLDQYLSFLFKCLSDKKKLNANRK